MELNGELTKEDQTKLMEMIFEWVTWDQDMIDETVFKGINMLLNMMKESMFEIATASGVSRDPEISMIYLGMLEALVKATSTMNEEFTELRTKLGI